jgi:hypothetical protein
MQKLARWLERWFGEAAVRATNNAAPPIRSADLG